MAFDPAKASRSRVLLLTGDDADARRRAVDALVQAAGLTPDDMDLESIIADAKPFPEWVGSACIVPFLADRRVVIVRNVLRTDLKKLYSDHAKFDKNHPAVKQLASLPESALLILVADEEVRAADSMAKDPPGAAQWPKVVPLAGGEVLTFAVPKAAEAPRILKERAESHGKKINPAASKLLIEMTAGKTDQALAELEKLVLYIGPDPEIQVADVQAAVTPDHEYSVFKLLDSITAGQTVQALTQLRTLFGKTAKIESEAFPRIFPVLLKQFRLIWQARAFIEARSGFSNPSPEALASLPQTPNLLKEKDWLRDKIMNTARRLGYPQLQTCFGLMLDADVKMKGARPHYNGLDTLEQTIIRMAQACKTK